MQKLMNELEPGDLDVSAQAGKNSVKDLTWLGSLSPHAQAVLIDKSMSLQCRVSNRFVDVCQVAFSFLEDLVMDPLGLACAATVGCSTYLDMLMSKSIERR